MMVSKLGSKRWQTGLTLLAGAIIIAAGVYLLALLTRAPVAAHPAASSAPAVGAAVVPPPPEPPASQLPAPQLPAPQLVVKRILNIDGPFRHGDYVWDDEGVPDGPLVITVDLAAQTLSVFRDGYEIGAAVILYGASEKPTPLGVFPVTEKDADHVSNLYDAPMPYMLRLTNDGVSIHGSDIELGLVTHGCIGVPTKFAEKLFAQVRLGDRVIITNGKMLELGEAITAT